MKCGEQNETDSRQTAISHGGNDFVMQFKLGGDGVYTLVMVTTPHRIVVVGMCHLTSGIWHVES